MSGKPDRLMVDAFHQAAIAGDHPGVVIDQGIAECRVQMPLGDCHADRHGEALPERTCGAFGAFELEIFRMAGAGAAELAEIADVLKRRPHIAGEVQQRIQQHRTMPGR